MPIMGRAKTPHSSWPPKVFCISMTWQFFRHSSVTWIIIIHSLLVFLSHFQPQTFSLIHSPLSSKHDVTNIPIGHYQSEAENLKIVLGCSPYALIWFLIPFVIWFLIAPVAASVLPSSSPYSKPDTLHLAIFFGSQISLLLERNSWSPSRSSLSVPSPQSCGEHPGLAHLTAFLSSVLELFACTWSL